MENAFLRWWGCGAFDAIFRDVNIAFDPYLFNENLEDAKPIYDYIFISHEHFDHCHPPTLQKLCRGDRFKKIFVSPGCVTPAQPINQTYGDAAFERDLPITKYLPEERSKSCIPNISTIAKRGRRFPRSFEADLGAIQVETIESGESAHSHIPTCGYLVTHKAKNISSSPTGDLHTPYPALKNIQGG